MKSKDLELLFTLLYQTDKKGGKSSSNYSLILKKVIGPDLPRSHIRSA